MNIGEYLQQIGVAGILVILVLDRVFAFVTKQRLGRDGDHGGTSDVSSALILQSLAEILARLEQRTGQMYDMNLRQGFVIDDVQKSLERLRVSSHLTNDHLQKIVAKVSEIS